MSATVTVEREFAPLLGRLAARGETGVVTAIRGKHKRLVCVNSGHVVLVISNVVEEQLDHGLRRDGLIDAGALASAREQAKEHGVDFCRFLMEQDHPGPDQILSALRRHTRGLLESTLAWSGAEFTFAKGRPDLGDQPTVELPIPAVLLSHARNLDWKLDRMRIKIGPPNATPFIDADRATFLGEADRSNVVAYLLGNCAGSATIQQLCDDSPADSDETIRALFALALMDLVQQPHDSKDARQQDAPITRAECDAILGGDYADHYAILGLDKNTLAGDIREAYYYLARRYHPDRFRSGPLMDLRLSVEAYFTRVTEAYNTLIDEVLRAEYDAQVADRMRQDVRPKEDSAYLANNYARARVLIDKRRFQDSVQFLENAIKLDDTHSDYHMELGRVLVRNPRRRQEAVQHLRRAIELSPANVAAFLALGELYAKMDRVEEAAEAFREVVRWEPDNIAARQGLEDLGETTTKKKPKTKEDEGGLLRGLFRK